MSQYRPLKEDESQVAAPAVAIRDHGLMRVVSRALVYFFVLFPGELVPFCRAAWILTALPAVTVRGRRWEIRTTHTAFRSKKSDFVRS